MSYKDKDELERLYWEKEMSIQEIADRFDKGYGTIYYWMDKHDLERRKAPKEMHPQIQYDSKGYRRISHRIGDERHYVFIHRLVAVAENGFEAAKDMEVHHKNLHPVDNSPENLELKSASEHRAEHNKTRHKVKVE